jgi:CO/xanthine dehydrogenase Mo-binding subunit
MLRAKACFASVFRIRAASAKFNNAPGRRVTVLQGSTRGFVMADLIYNVVKAPVGWMLFLDGVRVGGVYGTKDAAFEAAMVAASFAVGNGDGVQISVPSDAKLHDSEKTELWPKEWTAFLKP